MDQHVPVTNLAANIFLCTRCGYQATQFVNGALHTINPDHTVVSAGISEVSKQVEPDGYLKLRNTLTVINSAGQPVVVESRIGEPDGFPFFENRTGLIIPRSDRGRWTTACAAPLAFFPLRENQVVVEIAVYNTWGDQLDLYTGGIHTLDVFTQLIRLEQRRLEAECRDGILELHWLERQQRQHEDRYKQILLDLAGYLLHNRRYNGHKFSP